MSSWKLSCKGYRVHKLEHCAGVFVMTPHASRFLTGARSVVQESLSRHMARMDYLGGLTNVMRERCPREAFSFAPNLFLANRHALNNSLGRASIGARDSTVHRHIDLATAHTCDGLTGEPTCRNSCGGRSPSLWRRWKIDGWGRPEKRGSPLLRRAMDGMVYGGVLSP
jgi:hypothetical protein